MSITLMGYEIVNTVSHLFIEASVFLVFWILIYKMTNHRSPVSPLGGYGVDFSQESDDVAARVSLVATKILEHGVTSFCPTLVTSPPAVYHKVLQHVRTAQLGHNTARCSLWSGTCGKNIIHRVKCSSFWPFVPSANAGGSRSFTALRLGSLSRHELFLLQLLSPTGFTRDNS